MRPADLSRAVEAAVVTASAIGLSVDDAAVVSDSDRIAVRLLPSDTLARVTYEVHQADAGFEVEVVRRLAETHSPVGLLDPRVEPRVYLCDGFAVTLWTYYESFPSGIAPSVYARALLQLHTGMRRLEMMAPHFTDRVAEALVLLRDQDRTPDLDEADRELLNKTLRSLPVSITNRRGDEQLLHGEPWEGNLLNTHQGPLFVDLGTCCRGPVEFDIAHAPEEILEHYPDAKRDLVGECRVLMWAMVATWRWDRDDQFPDGRHWRVENLRQLRAAMERYGLEFGR